MFRDERHLVLTSGANALMFIIVSDDKSSRISPVRGLDKWIGAGLSTALLTMEI